VTHVRKIDPLDHFCPEDCTGVCELYSPKRYSDTPGNTRE